MALAFSQAEKEARANVRVSTGASAWLALGTLYHANGLLEKAEEAYRNVNELDIEAVDANFLLATLQRERGNFEEAEKRFNQVVQTTPDRLAAWYSLAEIRLKAGDWEAADRAYIEIIARHPSNPYALLGHARVLVAQQRRQEAIAALSKMHRDNPDFAGGLGLLAELLANAGESEEAAEIRKKIVRGSVLPFPDPSWEQLQQLTFDTQRLGVLYEEYKNAGEKEKALGFLDRIEKLDPEDWNAKILRGIYLAEIDDLEGAYDSYLKALAVGASPGLVYPLLVKTALLRGKVDEAEAQGEAGLRTIPDSVDLIVEMAGVRIFRRDLGGAKQLFQRALEIDPYHEKALKFLANLHVQRGEFEQAANLLTRYRQVKLTDPSASLRLAFVRTKQFSWPDVQMLLSEAEGALSEPPADAKEAFDSAKQLAEALRSADRKEEALRSFRIAAGLAPDDQDARVAVTELLVQLGRTDEAYQSVLKLVEIAPNTPGVRMAAGDVSMMAGHEDRAREEWSAGLNLLGPSGNGQTRQQLLGRLRSLERK